MVARSFLWPRNHTQVFSGLPGEPPPDRTWIAGVVRTPSRPFHLEPAGLGVHAPVPDQYSPPRFGPAPTGPGMPGYIASQMPSRSSRTSMTWALTPNLGATLSPKADRTPS